MVWDSSYRGTWIQKITSSYPWPYYENVMNKNLIKNQSILTEHSNQHLPFLHSEKFPKIFILEPEIS